MGIPNCGLPMSNRYEELGVSKRMMADRIINAMASHPAVTITDTHNPKKIAQRRLNIRLDLVDDELLHEQ